MFVSLHILTRFSVHVSPATLETFKLKDEQLSSYKLWGPSKRVPLVSVTARLQEGPQRPLPPIVHTLAESCHTVTVTNKTRGKPSHASPRLGHEEHVATILLLSLDSLCLREATCGASACMFHMKRNQSIMPMAHMSEPGEKSSRCSKSSVPQADHYFMDDCEVGPPSSVALGSLTRKRYVRQEICIV